MYIYIYISTFCNAAPPLMSTPCLAATPIPTTTAIGLCGLINKDNMYTLLKGNTHVKNQKAIDVLALNI
jgi:hypothetical protein